MANGRCRLHGGKNPGPPVGNDNAKKFGIYGSILTDEELELDIEIGSVDAELHLCRVQLMRTVNAKEEWDRLAAEGDEDELSKQNDLVETAEEEGERPFGAEADIMPFSSKKKVRKRPDFEGVAQRYLARIESLERTRKELGMTNPDDVREVAVRIKETVREMLDSVPGPPDGVEVPDAEEPQK